jgi:hypothetical protein
MNTKHPENLLINNLFSNIMRRILFYKQQAILTLSKAMTKQQEKKAVHHKQIAQEISLKRLCAFPRVYH